MKPFHYLPAIPVLLFAAAASGMSLEEVIVTATRRDADIQQLPMSVTALPGDTVAALRMSTIDDAARQVPDLVVSAAGNSTPWIFLRGLGTNDINANSIGAVAVHQDEVYLNSTAAQLQQLYDLERIEVLRGPQGTLHGRNTTGGVINVVSVNPQFADSLRATVSRGRFGAFDLEAMGNIGLGEQLAARIAVIRRSRDPLFRNTNGTGDASDVDNWAARAGLRWRSARQDWVLRLSGSSVDARATAFDKSIITEHPQRADIGEPRSEPLTRPGHERIDIWNTTLAGNIDLAETRLSSISAYVHSRRDGRVDLDSSAPDWIDQRRWNDASQYSQEFRLASLGQGPVEWLLGTSFFREELDATVDLLANEALGVPSLTFSSHTAYAQTDTSWALFGDATCQATPRLALFAGLRYTHESKSFGTSQEGYFNAPLDTAHHEHSWQEPSGSAGFSFSLAPDLTGYGRYARGFRAGGFNAGGGVDDPAFGPEFVDLVELGLKGEFLQHRLRANFAAFTNAVHDMQVYALVATPAGPTTQYLTNAARATTRGVEAEVQWRATARLQLQLAAAYLDARFDEYVDAQDVDRSGNRLPGAPKYTLGGIARQEWPLAGGTKLTLTLDASYRDGFHFDNANTARYAAGGNTLLGARLDWRAARDRYGIALWARNLTGETSFARATSFLVFDSIAVGDPRTFGIELAARIGN